MTNTLGVYNPIFYANEALIALEAQLGMASRVHRGFESERNSFRQGDTINIRKPSTFTAQDAPSSSQNVTTETVAITLDYWKEVKFTLTDRELSITTERIIADHIRPAAYALALDIDTKLCALYKKIPWTYNTTGDPGSAPVVADITNGRLRLFTNKVPLTPGMVHMMVDGNLEAGFLGLEAFGQWQGAGAQGVQTQLTGTLGNRFGLEIFANQNVQTHTAGTATDIAGAISGTPAAGATSITVASLGADGTTYLEGTAISIAGHTQRYVLTATATVTSNAATFSIFPALKSALAGSEVVTIYEAGSSGSQKIENLVFHRNAFALVSAPLSEMGGDLGARIATVTDPITGLSLRSRLFYDGDNSAVKVALDVLYGVKCLDPNMAVRAREDIS